MKIIIGLIFLLIISFYKTDNYRAVFITTDTFQIVKQPTRAITVQKKDSLQYIGVDSFSAQPGTKSVLFNSKGTKLYAMNLEGLSISEFDAFSKQKCREFKFTPTMGIGWDYITRKAIPSIQEKPVEGCFSHQDKILWVSLHNAGGIVPIWVDSIASKNYLIDTFKVKHYTIMDKRAQTLHFGDAPLIKTGNTPKVITVTGDNKYLLVSNWHSKTISVLAINDSVYPFARLVKHIPMIAIPRGIVIDDKAQKSYVAIMGSSYICVINNTNWEVERYIKVAENPRHIVMDTIGNLYVSINKLSEVQCINTSNNTIAFSTTTAKQPRTIALSKNKKFLFVTCYEGNKLEIYSIDKKGFSLLTSLPCYGKPVGVDLHETNDALEAWVCCYVKGNIKVFRFNKIQ